MVKRDRVIDNILVFTGRCVVVFHGILVLYLSVAVIDE